MATGFNLYSYSGGIAGADFSVGGGLTGQNGNGNASGQFLFVALDGITEDTFVVYKNDNITSGLIPMGISNNDPKIGGQLSVQCLGRSKLVAGAGGMALGWEIGADAAGRGVRKQATLTGANLGDFVMGICNCAADVGNVGAVELIGRYRV